MDEVEDFLEHFGVKGMRWGVRKDDPGGPTDVTVKTRPGRRVKAAGGERHDASEDAVAAVKLKQKAKKSTTDSLSNAELEALIRRMNLEQQYSKLKGDGPIAKGHKVAKEILGIGKTAQEAIGLGTKLKDQLSK